MEAIHGQILVIPDPPSALRSWRGIFFGALPSGISYQDPKVFETIGCCSLVCESSCTLHDTTPK